MHFYFSQGDVFRANAYQICQERKKKPACSDGKQAGVNVARRNTAESRTDRSSYRVMQKEFRPMEIQNGTAFSYLLTDDTLLLVNVTTIMGYKEG